MTTQPPAQGVSDDLSRSYSVLHNLLQRSWKEVYIGTKKYQLTLTVTPEHMERINAAMDVRTRELQQAQPTWTKEMLADVDLRADGLYHRINCGLQQAQVVGDTVPQFRIRGCSDWYDGYADFSDGKDWEERTLYASPQSSAPVVGDDDIDRMRDVYMSVTQREAYERILKAALTGRGL